MSLDGFPRDNDKVLIRWHHHHRGVTHTAHSSHCPPVFLTHNASFTFFLLLWKSLSEIYVLYQSIMRFYSSCVVSDHRLVVGCLRYVQSRETMSCHRYFMLSSNQEAIQVRSGKVSAGPECLDITWQILKNMNIVCPEEYSKIWII